MGPSHTRPAHRLACVALAAALNRAGEIAGSVDRDTAVDKRLLIKG